MRTFFNVSRWILTIGLFCFGPSMGAQAVYFVNSLAEPGGDGLTWNTAFRDLQPALDSACLNAPAEIWVAAGTYYPAQNVEGTSSGDTDRSNTFLMCTGVTLYGGFAGVETSLAERDWMTNFTRLSGDVDRNDVLDTNAYNVVTFIGTEHTAALDGFTISSGHANVLENIVTSEFSGGGIYMDSAQATLRNCIISGNAALTGGGIFSTASTSAIYNCQIINNTVTGDFGWGAGIANIEGSVAVLEDCILENNVADSYGGAVYNFDNAEVRLSNCTIRLNHAQSGAGLYSSSNTTAYLDTCYISENNVSENGGGVFIADNSKSEIYHCTFFQNVALISGGGICLNSLTELYLFESKLEANQALNGGGIYMSGYAECTLLNSSLLGNEAISNGGGIYNLSTFATLTNCLITGSHASGSGGAFFNTSGNFNPPTVSRLTNCTISGNGCVGNGGGVYNDVESIIELNSSIIWNNVANDSTDNTTSSVFNRAGGNVFSRYSLIQNSGGSVSWDAAIGTDLGGNLDQDPLFVENTDILNLPNSTGDLHLQLLSPAINAGALDTTKLDLPLTDLDGNPRLVHNRIDLGAYEFQEDITFPDCSISGPLQVFSYANEDYAGPDNMVSYSWSVEGNGVIIGPDDQQSVTVVAGALNAFLLILTTTDSEQDTSTCAVAVNIQIDCNLYGAAEVLYVDSDATGTNSGLSWMDAFTNLTDALQIDCAGSKEVWVAAGTYYPTSIRNNFESSFQLKNDVALYGGFVGTELTLEERDIENNPTTLSGDIDQEGSLRGNVYNVVNGSATDTTAVLDGFIVSGGSAQWIVFQFTQYYEEYEERSSGAGLFIFQGSPTISNCVFTANKAYQGAGCMNIGGSPVMTNCTFSSNGTQFIGRGGGMFNAENASPVLTNCNFKLNSANQFGGGMINKASSPILTNCIFLDNQVNSLSGYAGGMNNYESSPTLTNCTFMGNSGGFAGGAMNNEMNSTPIITQCDFISNSADRGAGMHNTYESSPVLLNCRFLNHRAFFDGFGAGMLNQFNSNPHLTGCIFEENTVDRYGGGMYNSNSSPTLINCLFKSNVAHEVGGGGISNRSSAPILSGCVFTGNFAFDGGAIYNFENASPTLINCSISGNIASRGGGIFNDNSNPSLTNCILWNNRHDGDAQVTASSILNFSSTPFVFNSLIANSGGSEFWSIDLGFDAGNNVDFDPLFVKDYNFDIFPDPLVDIRLTPCSEAIDAGTPDTMGLFLPALDPDGNARIINDRIDLGAYEFNGMIGVPVCLIAGPDTVFSESTQLFSGPIGMASYEWTIIGNGTIVGSSTDQEVNVEAGMVNSYSIILKVQDPDQLCFTTCTLYVEIIFDCGIFGTSDILYVNHQATGDNNGTSWSDAYISLQDALKTSCPEINQVWVAAGTYYPSAIPTDRDATFHLVNGLQLYGGFAGTELTLEERDWQANQTILSGDIDGDFSLMNNAFTVVTGSGTDTTAQLDGFVITGGNSDENGQGGDPHKSGGGMYNVNGSPVVRNCNFTGNSVIWQGGGMYNVDASPVMTNCTFNGNNALESGGGIFNSHSFPVLKDCSFNGNQAQFLGGGISMVNGSSGQLANCIFEGNIVSGLASGGGGINIDSSAPVLTRCVFRNNTALNGLGGGVHISTGARPVFVYCTFEENQSLFGGGFREHSSTSHFIACIFKDNSAISGGGGNVTAISDSKFTNCQFISNSASSSGGGLVGYASSLSLFNCEFSANIAEEDGAGTWLYDATIDAVNSTFTGNAASQHGGAFFNNGNSKLKLTNSTISGNDAGGDGGGIYNLDSTSLTVTNSIIWNNRANANTEISSSSVFNDTTSITTVSHSIIANSGSSQDWNTEIGLDLGGNLDSDPSFVENVDLSTVPDTSGDVHLLMISPAINTGTPDTTGLHLPIVDADGNPRIFNFRIDMGPYEYQGIVSVHPAAEPLLSLEVHPNPAREILYVFSSAEAGDIVISDATGQIVASFTDLMSGPGDNIKLDISKLSPGLYSLLFTTENGPDGVAKFVVVR
jgi:parallel beta-helix repeat protein